MNRKMIGQVLGFLLILECLFLAPGALVSALYREFFAFRAFASTMLLSLSVGLLLYTLCRGASKTFYAREGFIIVGLGWILLSAIGALPFWVAGEIPRYVDALFEVISGFTTTGSSVLTNVEAMSKGLLFWRSFTHWLGGMGILVFLLAVVPMGQGGGYSVHLLRAESPGPSVGKLVPKIRQTAAILYGIYIALTVLCLFFLLLGGMPLFDSLCTAFGTAGTGGFGVKNNSIAGYSPYLQNVCTVFMALFGVNFSVYFLLLLGRFKEAFMGEELRLYWGTIFAAVAIITWNITPLYDGVRPALHDAAFTVSSIITTTGFATADFNLWPQLSRTILVMLMIMGACAGSTGGGTKVARMLILLKALRAKLRQALHPRSVNLVRVDGQTASDETVQGVYTYMTAYFAIAILSILLLTLDNLSFETNVTAVLACLNNIGPGLGAVGPTGNFAHFSDLSKIVLMANMLLGRLEIFPLLMLVYPGTWKRAG